MNKNEFIEVLEKSLIRLPKADRDDILSDYEAHFAIGTESGKTEEEVAASLGDPNELAQTYLENLPEGSKGAPAAVASEEEAAEPETKATADAAEEKTAPAYNEPTYSAPTYGAPSAPRAAAAYDYSGKTDDKPDTGSIVLVVFLSIAAFFALISIISAWFTLPGIAIGCFAGTAALLAAGIAFITQSVAFGIGFIFIALALIAFGVLAILASVAAVKGIIWLVNQFIKLCKNILYGGNE